MNNSRDKFKQFSSLTNFKSDFNNQPSKNEATSRNQSMRMNF